MFDVVDDGAEDAGCYPVTGASILARPASILATYTIYLAVFVIYTNDYWQTHSSKILALLHDGTIAIRDLRVMGKEKWGMAHTRQGYSQFRPRADRPNERSSEGFIILGRILNREMLQRSERQR